LYGLRIIIINGLIFINDIGDKVTINPQDANIEKYILQEEEAHLY